MLWSNLLKYFVLLVSCVSQLQGISLNNIVKDSYAKPAACPSIAQADLEAGKKLFKDALQFQLNDADIKEWDKLGFKAYKTQDETTSYIIVQEKEDMRAGKGLYIFRMKGVPVLLEAPHFPSDMHTGTIAKYFFEEEPIVASAWNTAHRKCIDMAHAASTYFNALTFVFGELFPQEGQVLQLHAFDEEKHNVSTDLILSSTLRAPTQVFQQKAACLKKKWKDSFSVSIFPEDLDLLGGTLNENSKVFRSVAKGTFFHLEMNENLRQFLLKSKGARDEVWNCLLGAVR